MFYSNAVETHYSIGTETSLLQLQVTFPESVVPKKRSQTLLLSILII
jgi:hypothetical protein